MKNLFKLFLTVLILALSPLTAQETPYVILISFDGFRWDYPSRGITPNFDEIRENGVAAVSLEPVYPSKTFPNHLSIITGMYPENHGIILNEFSDPFSGARYRMSDTTAIRDGKWYLGEAFWETAERQGITTASYFWPGSELHDPARRPTYRELYEHNRPYEERIAGVLRWLQLPPAERPHFITLYFHETDTQGHSFGPDAPDTNQAMQRLDSMLGLLIEGLEKIGMRAQTNLIVVSDHGMTAVNTEKIVNIEKILEGFECEYTGYGPNIMIRPQPEEIKAVYEQLHRSEHHFRVYLRETMPAHYHFSHHPFIPPVIVDADMGWTLTTHASEAWLRRRGGSGGNHGFDNHHRDMHGIFYAMGPAFKSGYPCGTLRNIDIYPLLCRIYNIEARQNIDGELERIGFILK